MYICMYINIICINEDEDDVVDDDDDDDDDDDLVDDDNDDEEEGEKQTMVIKLSIDEFFFDSYMLYVSRNFHYGKVAIKMSLLEQR